MGAWGTKVQTTTLSALEGDIINSLDPVVGVDPTKNAPSISVVNTALGTLDTAVDTLNDNLTASNQTAGVTDVPFRFGCTDDGKFGYIINQGGADSVIPFNSNELKQLFRLYESGSAPYLGYVDIESGSGIGVNTKTSINTGYATISTNNGTTFTITALKKINVGYFRQSLTPTLISISLNIGQSTDITLSSHETCAGYIVE